MQAIARVNRVFKDKPAALSWITSGSPISSNRLSRPTRKAAAVARQASTPAEAIAAMREKHGGRLRNPPRIRLGQMERRHTGGTPRAHSRRAGACAHARQRESEIHADRHRSLEGIRAVRGASDEALGVRDDVAFFQAVKSALAKNIRPWIASRGGNGSRHPVNLLAKAVVARRGASSMCLQPQGWKNPDISILSERFLAEVRRLKKSTRYVRRRTAREIVEGRNQTAFGRESGSCRAGSSVRCWKRH